MLLTFREEASIVIGEVTAQKPSITKLVIALNEFDPVAFRQAQLIGASGYKIICLRSSACELVGLCGFGPPPSSTMGQAGGNGNQ